MIVKTIIYNCLHHLHNFYDFHLLQKMQIPFSVMTEFALVCILLFGMTNAYVVQEDKTLNGIIHSTFREAYIHNETVRILCTRANSKYSILDDDAPYSLLFYATHIELIRFCIFYLI